MLYFDTYITFIVTVTPGENSTITPCDSGILTTGDKISVTPVDSDTLNSVTVFQ
jgi:hypothetical protein